MTPEKPGPKEVRGVLPLAELCASVPELWSPRVIASVNQHLLKVARVLGEFPWHAHTEEDELFLVLRGALTIGRAESDGGPVTLHAGEACVVPRGVRHNTSAAEATWIALFEPASTAHTGEERTAMTRTLEEQMRPLR